MKKNNNESRLRQSLLGISKVHFLFVLLLVGQIILYDSSKLIPPEIVLERWIAATALLAVTGVIWYLTKVKAGHLSFYKSLLLTYIVSDIALASFLVYSTRGMASRAVLLYIIPIVISGVLLSRAALFAAAILCIAAYSLTAVSYFVLNFNEGYKVELYGEVGFFSIIFLLLASVLSIVLHSKK